MSLLSRRSQFFLFHFFIARVSGHFENEQLEALVSGLLLNVINNGTRTDWSPIRHYDFNTEKVCN